MITNKQALRECFEKWWEINYHNGKPPRFGWEYWRDGEGYQIDDDESELDGMWESWQAAHSEKLEAAEKRIAELEAREVQLPKPHAYLIWIQAGYAPDDYWDDVSVSHSEKDKCCDGSDRYPVYARWEIEEVLAAAGITVKGDSE